MTLKKIKVKPVSELRRDPVSGDWILLAPLRGRRHKFEGRIKIELAKNKCPFENPQKFGNAPPVLVYQNSDKNDWFLQVIPNKYPAVGPNGHGSIHKDGLYQIKDGVGYHEIVIFRDHNRYLAEYNTKEIEKVVLAYRERYLSLANNKFF